MPDPALTCVPASATELRGDTRLERLSVVIPARDEAACIASTVEHLHLELRLHGIPHEIVVVDDGSTDETWSILSATAESIDELVPVRNPGPNGFGRAIQRGLTASSGDAVVIMMADESDDCRDVVRYWNTLQQGYDCVFGSRFMKQGGTIDYPRVKWLVNRAANLFIRILFGIRLNDTTNAFKAYRREVIEGCGPILSPHFNITVELPLKAIVRGYTWTTIPITWRNRRTGIAKLKIREMGSRYLFIVAYVWLERYFSRGDYRKTSVPVTSTSLRQSPQDNPFARATVLPAQPKNREPSSRSHWLNGCVCTAAILLGMCLVFPFIGSFGTNVPVADDWDLLHTSLQWHEKGVDVRSLLAPHNEHCLALPRLIQHSLLAASGGNFRAVLFANGGIALATLWLLVHHVRRWPLSPGLMTLVATALAVLVTAWCQWQNLLWAFQMPWLLLPLILVSAATCVSKSRTPGQALAAAAAAASLSVFCLANGLLVGWSLAPVMLVRLRDEPRDQAVAFGAAFGACVVTTTLVGAWLIHGSNGPQAGGLHAVFAAPFDAIRSVLAILGSPFDARNAFLGRKDLSTMAGTISLVTGLAAARWSLQLPPTKARAASLGLALMAYGLTSTLAVVFGRLGMISAGPIESRYLGFSLFWNAGMLVCLAGAAAWLDGGPARRACRWITAIVAGASIAATVAAMPFFLAHGRNMRQALREHQSIYRNASSPGGREPLEKISRHYGAERLLQNFQRMERAGIAHREYSPNVTPLPPAP